MNNNFLRGLCLIFLFVITTLTAFAQNDELIQGKWNLTGTLPKSKNERTFSWFLEWTFSDGNFLQTGYPPFSQKGKYRILKQDGDKLTLELYEQSGNFGTKDKQIEIVVNKETQTLKIDGKEGFARVKKKEEPKSSQVLPLTDEEYAVFMTVLGKDRSLFVVKDKTGVDYFGGSGTDFLKGTFAELNSETVEDFLAKNKESAQIEKKFPTKNEYTLITPAELGKFFNKRLDWEGFYKQYPKSGGVVRFSRVGFSKDGKQALIFAAHSCGGLCGEGNYYLLNKENNEWKVIKKQMTWIS